MSLLKILWGGKESFNHLSFVDDDGPEGHDTNTRPRAAPLRPPCCPAGLVRGGREEKRERGCLCSTAGKHRVVEMGGSKYHCRTGLDTLSSRPCMHTHAGRHVEHWKEKTRVRTARKQQQRQQPHQQQHQETCRTTTTTTTTTIPSSSIPPSPSLLLLLPPSFHLRRGRWQDHDLGQETSRFSVNTNSVPRKSAGTTRPHQEGWEGWKQRQQQQ